MPCCAKDRAEACFRGTFGSDTVTGGDRIRLVLRGLGWRAVVDQLAT